MSSFKKIKKASKYADCKNSGKESLLKYYGVKTERRGQWQDRNFEPSSGHIIFFDWEGDGVTDHVGIVERVENGYVYTVEGNSGDSVRQNSYPIGSSSIYVHGKSVLSIIS